MVSRFHLYRHIPVNIWRLTSPSSVLLPMIDTILCCHVSHPFPVKYPAFFCYARSKIRSFALFARLFSFSSSSPGKIGFFVTILPFGTFPHTHTGKSDGQVHGCSFFLNALFTILSSSEWNVMIHNLPPGFSKSIMSSKESRKTSSSRFSSIRIA